MEKLILLLVILLVSCGEEVLNTKSQSDNTGVDNQQISNLKRCAQMQLDKPPVDILYVVDNSGSSLSGDFAAIKSSIANTISTISSEFKYHIYIAPLIAPSGSSYDDHTLIVENTDGLHSDVRSNVKSINQLTSQDLFAPASGNNYEAGFERARSLIKQNRANGIFRDKAHTIIVMVSNGDDSTSTVQGVNPYRRQDVFNAHVEEFKKLKQSLEAQSFRFMSLVAHRACKSGYKVGRDYKEMSQIMYDELPSSYQNDPNNTKDSRDLCGSIADVFASVNSTIRSVVTGHKYDHWLISTANSSEIQEDDIQLYKITSAGSRIEIPRGSTNGFEYLGFKTGLETRYYPERGAPVTGLVVKLNGTARTQYPECIEAKTKTPVVFYGWAVIPRKPVESSIVVKVNGNDVPKSNSNGWSYEGYRDSQNIKVVVGNSSKEPGDYRSGYFIKLNGSAKVSNGDNVEVFYTPAPLD